MSSARRACVRVLSTIKTPPPFSIADTTTVFRTKSTLELIRSLLVFKLCTLQALVTHSKTLIDSSKRIFGSTFTSFVIKHTFFAHFCAGESATDIQPVLAKLRSAGIGGILDYAAESDLGPAAPSLQRARPSDSSSSEAQLDRNLEVTIRAVEAAASVGGSAAVKLTALADPALLRHVSDMVHDHRRAFRRFNLELEPCPYVTLRPSLPTLRRVLVGPGLSEGEVDDLYRACNYIGDNQLDYIQWCDFLALLRLGGEESLAAAAQVRRGLSPEGLFALLSPAATVALTPDERDRLKAVLRRADELAQAAARCKVAIMVDAEQSYLQPAIDWVTTTMQRKYNRSDPASWTQPEAAHVLRLHSERQLLYQPLRSRHSSRSMPQQAQPAPRLRPAALLPEHAVVYSTIQAYTVDAVPRLTLELFRAEREGYLQSVKLVRGAYMHQERARAAQLGYSDPIHPTLEATHASYFECSQLLLAAAHHKQATVLFATHNESSVIHAARRMLELGMQPDDLHVSFGQLLGMCDHLTFSLASSRFRSYKYIPYGRVDEVIPYLLRRAQENSDLLSGGVQKEISLLQSELSNRLWRRTTS